MLVEQLSDSRLHPLQPLDAILELFDFTISDARQTAVDDRLQVAMDVSRATASLYKSIKSIPTRIIVPAGEGQGKCPL